ncbi:MAG: hypothetical protein ACLPX5_11455 [Dissulfurispiraceae bacterium]
MFDLHGNLKLDNAARFAVMGSALARCLFSFFLLALAGEIGIHVQANLLDLKEFSSSGRIGCNMCSGILSKSLFQMLVAEGINVRSSVVKRSFNSCLLRMDAGTRQLEC